MRRFISITLLSVVAGSALLATGCSSANEKPYALTGDRPRLTAQERARYTDDKGHFRPEWVSRETRP